MLRQFFLFIAMVIFSLACSENKIEQGPVKDLADLQQRVSQLNQLTTNLDSNRTQLYSLIREFNSTRAESDQFDIASMDTLLGAEEQDLLRAMFKEEKDISYTGLLKNIIEKNNDIGKLNNQITDLQNQLPKPYAVQKGDTHYQIVRDYLMTQYGLDKKQAREIAWKTVMTDNLVPGNQVWLLYKDGNVGTYVTQGEAKIPPMTIEQWAKQRLIQKAYEQGKLDAQPKSESVSSLESPNKLISQN